MTLAIRNDSVSAAVVVMLACHKICGVTHAALRQLPS
jgi:hypothetical protein